MSHAFTPDASAALGGPDWLAARRARAAERLADVVVADRRRGDLALLADQPARPRAVPAVDRRRARRAGVRAGPRRRSVRCRARRPRRARGGARRAGGPPRGGSRARGAGRHRVRHRHVRSDPGRAVARLGVRRVARRVHGAARRVPRRRRLRPRAPGRGGRAADRGPALGRRRRPGVVPAHARRGRGGERGHGRSSATRRRRGSRTSSTASSSSRSATAPTSATSSVQEYGAAHVVDRAAAGAPRPRRHGVVVGGRARRRLRPPADRDPARRSGRGERPARGLLRRRRADARLPHVPGPRRAPHPQRPAVQGRGGGHRPLRLQRAHPHPARRAEGRGHAVEPQPRAQRGRRRGVDPEPRDRGRRRAVLARVDGRVRSTTTSATTSRPAACGPRTPSG